MFGRKKKAKEQENTNPGWVEQLTAKAPPQGAKLTEEGIAKLSRLRRFNIPAREVLWLSDEDVNRLAMFRRRVATDGVAEYIIPGTVFAAALPHEREWLSRFEVTEASAPTELPEWEKELVSEEAVQTALAAEQARVIDKAVRYARASGYCTETNSALQQVYSGGTGARFYDSDGFDCRGLDKDNFNNDGFDRDGHDREGYDPAGYNREGLNRQGESMRSLRGETDENGNHWCSSCMMYGCGA